MEKNINPESLFSNKKKDEAKRKKELIRFLIILLTSNLLTYFSTVLINYSQDEEERTDPLEDLELIKIKARSLVPFTEGKEVKLINKNSEALCKTAKLISKEASYAEELSDDFTVAVAKDCLQFLHTAQQIEIVPVMYEVTSNKRKSAYEIVY